MRLPRPVNALRRRQQLLEHVRLLYPLVARRFGQEIKGSEARYSIHHTMGHKADRHIVDHLTRFGHRQGGGRQVNRRWYYVVAMYRLLQEVSGRIAKVRRACASKALPDLLHGCHQQRSAATCRVDYAQIVTPYLRPVELTPLRNTVVKG